MLAAMRRIAASIVVAVAMTACSSSKIVVVERSTHPPALSAAALHGPASPSASPSPVAPLQGHIAFVSDRAGAITQVFTMDANGSHVTQVSDGPTDVIEPAYAPNGKLIAYVRVFTNGAAKTYVVYIWDESGGDQAATPADGRSLNPTWSPSGTYVAVTDGSQGPQRIAAFQPATGGSLQPITPAVGAFDPTFAPDGSAMAFSRLDKSCFRQKQGIPCYAHIWSMDLSSGKMTQLTQGNSVDLGAAWSPAGDRIAYASETGTTGNFDIFTMSPTGANVQQLTDAPEADLSPSWSPDGTRIAFSSRRDGNAEIYEMHADGTQQTNVTQDPAQDTDPSWSV